MVLVGKEMTPPTEVAQWLRVLCDSHGGESVLTVDVIPVEPTPAHSLFHVTSSVPVDIRLPNSC